MNRRHQYMPVRPTGTVHMQTGISPDDNGFAYKERTDQFPRIIDILASFVWVVACDRGSSKV